MGVIMLGADHCSAPTAVREGLAFERSCQGRALGMLKASFPDGEFVLLSTCNRVEIYAAGDPFPPKADELVRFLARFHSIPSEKMVGHLIVRHGETAIAHLLRVAAGLESLVPGESQVLGQVRDAYRAASGCATVGPILHVLFQRALRAGKRVRQMTALGQSVPSIPSVAVGLARKLSNGLDDKTVLVVGAGQMASLAVQHLRAHRPGAILVANRQFERAQSLALRCGGRAVALERLDEALTEADVVISTTGAPGHIVSYDRLNAVQQRRHNRSLLIIDLAMPRDFDPSICNLDQIRLYNVDDLRRNLGQYDPGCSSELESARAIVRAEARACSSALEHRRDISTALRRIGDQAETILDRELSRLFARQQHLTDEARAEISYAMSRVCNQLLHQPRVVLRTATSGDDSRDPAVLIEAALRIFGISDMDKTRRTIVKKRARHCRIQQARQSECVVNVASR